MGDLQKVPGIGVKKEKLLTELGYASLSELKEADADELYLRACVKEGWQLDKCVLYAFRCAVAYANDSEPDSSRYRWWYFTDKAKSDETTSIE